ncbi:MAG: hypothetical protein NTX81_04030 [Candidatus Bathyarchaeota archaeon]|nr:hypothetical protein [Candidatus Bathyarchaeota archaeon]
MTILNKYVFHKYVGVILKSKFRFIMPIVLWGVAKLYGCIWVYSKFTLIPQEHAASLFGTPWTKLYGESIGPTWVFLFVGWDTQWYITLASGLSFVSTFFPGYPLVIRSFAEIVNNYWIVAIMISIILGFISLPLFQAIAEEYMTHGEALGSTIMMSFFPYIFLFTTVAYSESLFLVSILASWYLYLRNRLIASSLCNIFVILTKTYGILIVLPMLLDLAIRRKWKQIPIILAPVFLITTIIMPFVHKDILNRLILELNTATWSVSRENLGNYWFRDFIVPIFTSKNPMIYFHYFHAYALAFIVLIGYLAIRTVKMDWRLGLYSSIMFLIIMIFGYTNGIIRYASFIFPIWLGTKIKNPAIIVPVVILFFIHSLVLWYQFLWGQYPM